MHSPAPTVVPSLRNTKRLVLRFAWKGSTGIPRLFVSWMWIMAAPPIGICLVVLCQFNPRKGLVGRTWAFSWEHVHQLYQLKKWFAWPRQVHQFDLDVWQSDRIKFGYQLEDTHRRPLNYRTINLKRYNSSQEVWANSNWAVYVTHNITGSETN